MKKIILLIIFSLFIITVSSQAVNAKACFTSDDCSGSDICDFFECKSKSSSSNICATNADCSSGKYCDLFSCKNKKGNGGSCSADWVCKSGYKCLGLVCAKPGSKDTACFTNDECNSGLYCELFTCQNQKGSGSSCTADWVCKSGLTCDGSTLKCAHSPREEGEGCGLADPCANGLYCSNGVAGSCNKQVGAGGDCNLLVSNMCKPGLVCDGSTSKCAHTPREKGEGCGVFDPCADDFFCSDVLGVAGVCEDRLGVGSKCLDSSQCRDELDCRITPKFESLCFPQKGNTVFDRETCLELYDKTTHNNVQKGDVALTIGTGTGATTGVGGSVQAGVVYGNDGKYGCFFTSCFGGEVSIGAQVFSGVGQYVNYDVIRGAGPSIVEIGGVGKFVSIAVSQEFSPDMSYEGVEESFGLGVGIAPPISAGTYSCNTIVDTYKAPFEGKVTTIPESDEGLDPEMKVFFDSFNEAPVALCNDVTVCYDSSTCTANANINNKSYDPDRDPISITQIPLGPYTVGTQNITMIVEDTKGLNASCSATVHVIDCDVPQIICPENKIIQTNSRKKIAVPLQAHTKDTCNSKPTIQGTNKTKYKKGNYTINFTTIDLQGNNASCTTTLSIQFTPKESEPEIVTKFFNKMDAVNNWQETVRKKLNEKIPSEKIKEFFKEDMSIYEN